MSQQPNLFPQAQAVPATPPAAKAVAAQPAEPGGQTPKVAEVLLLDPATVHTPADNRAIPPETLTELIASISDIGQQVPGMVRPRPGQPGHWDCIGGNRRLVAVRILGRKFKAVVVPGEVSDADLVKLRLTENCIREAMSPLEVAADIARYMQMTGCSQADAAEKLHLSPSAVSKALTVKKLAPDLHVHVENFAVSPAAAYLIATLPTHEQQRQAMKKTMEGNLKREAVERLVGAMKNAGKPAKQIKAMKLSCGDVKVEIKGNPVDALKVFVAKAAEVLKKMEKEALPVEVLPSLLK